MRKLSAALIVGIMFFVCFAVGISVTPAVHGEAVPGLFDTKVTNWPQVPVPALDQSATTLNQWEPYAGNSWLAQTFTSTQTADIARVELYLNPLTTMGSLDIWIYTTVSGYINSPVGPGPQNYLWNEIGAGYTAFDFPLGYPLSVSQEYAIITQPQGGFDYDWARSSASNPYSMGWALKFDGTETPIDGGMADFAFYEYYYDYVDVTLNKVAWDGGGDFALAVDGTTSHIYEFTRASGSWSDWGEFQPGAEFNDIDYHSTTDEFYIAGQSSGLFATAWRWSTGSGFSSYGAPTNGIFYGITACDASEYPFVLCAVGYEIGSPDKALVAWYDVMMPGWYIESYSIGIPDYDVLFDVDYDPGWAEYFAVGVDTTGRGVVYRLPGVGSGAYEMTEWQGWTPINPLYAISFQSGGSYGIMAGYQNGYTGNIYRSDGALQPIVLLDSMDTLHDVDWFPTGDIAVIVGEHGGSGVYYHHNLNDNSVVDLSGKLPPGTGPLYGVACKAATSPRSAVVVGVAGAIAAFPQASDISTQVRINAAFPHTFNIDFWAQANPAAPLGAGPSLLNTQVDPDAVYTFFVEANYTVGGVDQWVAAPVAIDLDAWWDQGGAPGSTPVDATWSDLPDTRTRQFSITWTSAGGAVLNQPSPGPLNDEFTVVSSWEDPGIYPNQAHRVYINVSFGRQTYAADGNGFVNLGATGGRIWDFNSGLNDPNSWDFNFGVYDSVQTGARNDTWEEFGVNEAVSISVTGNPTRNAPPGATWGAMTPSSDITYSSNLPYWVNVSLVDVLYLNGIGPGPNIPVNNIRIQNVNPQANAGNSGISAMTPFVAPGLANELGVWGVAGPGGEQPTPLNGTYAFGDYGSDFNSPGAYTTIVNWEAQVPVVQEGLYWTTITMRIVSI